MKLPTRFALLAALFASSGAIAADMLPLKQGLYVPVGRPCRGASNADIVNYWGGKSSIGASGRMHDQEHDAQRQCLHAQGPMP